MSLYNNKFNLNTILEIDRFRYKNRKENSITLLLRSLFSLLFYNFKEDTQIINADFLFFKSSDRKDCDLFFDTVINQCEYKKTVLNISNYEFRICFIKWFLLFYLWKYFSSIRNENIRLLESLYLYFKFIRYFYNSIWKLRNSKFKIVVVFSDMQPMDNLVSQYFQKRGTKTVTLQHGLYIEYLNFDTPLVVQYKNVISDYFVAWGEETRSLILKYHPKINIRICGKPIVLNREPVKSNDFISIIFDSNYLASYNRKLLEVGNEICKRLNIKMHIRLHPLNNINDYVIDPEILEEDADVYNSKFVIGHASTFLFELMACGIPAYKLLSNVPSNVINQKICFSTADDLLLIIDNALDFKIESKFYIQFCGDESKAKYSELFTNLMDKNENHL